MYFSDIYSNQPVPDSLKENKVLWGKSVEQTESVMHILMNAHQL